MKRGCAILGLLVVSILLISISFVSAGLFGDIWDRITGKVTENVTNGTETSPIEEEPIPPEPEPPVEEPPEDSECNEGDEKYYTCEDGTNIPECECENGGWVCEMSARENCPDVGDEPEKCAAEIKITFNKEVYRIGDPVKIIIEILDAQGNNLPNYNFYGQMYDDRWHSADLQKTNAEGYFIQTGTAEKPAGGVTEVRFKVYTRETDSCSSVEDIEEVKFELEDCGMGECAPELECEDKIRMCGGECAPCPEEDRDGDIFYPCNGCELEAKCYPYGYRKAGNYCLDENDMFVSQLGDDAQCENNFECKTNLCINGGCVSSNLWNKFLEWFKKLFGGGEDREEKDCSKLLIEKDIGDYEYNQSVYGHKDMQVPVYSEGGVQVDIVKCCAAQYLQSEKDVIGLVCLFDNEEDVRNSLRWLVAKEENLDLGEYKGEKLIIGSQDSLAIWMSDEYIIASGGDPNRGGELVEQITDAYLKKYKSDFDLTEDDIPYVEPEPEPVPCEDIVDDEEQAGCYIDLAMANSDASLCENIVYDTEHRNKCYIHVAEHTGDASICDKVSDNDLREKCYFWVAEQEGDVKVCEEMSDSSLQNECYVNVAEKTGDANFCDKIADSHIADKCYRDVGIQTNDRSLCELIIDDGPATLNTKDECYAGTD